MQIATTIMGFGQEAIRQEFNQAELSFLFSGPDLILAENDRTALAIRSARANINESFGPRDVLDRPDPPQLIPVVPQIDSTMVSLLQELARSAAQSPSSVDREQSALFATRIATPQAVADNLAAIENATGVIAAASGPLLAPAGLPGLVVRRESGIALAGVLFLGLLAAGAVTYFWIKRPSRG